MNRGRRRRHRRWRMVADELQRKSSGGWRTSGRGRDSDGVVLLDDDAQWLTVVTPADGSLAYTSRGRTTEGEPWWMAVTYDDFRPCPATAKSKTLSSAANHTASGSSVLEGCISRQLCSHSSLFLKSSVLICCLMHESATLFSLVL